METKKLPKTSPRIYECIVCQSSMISLSQLHFHQTYRHTQEELSLSTIGRQCLLINKLEGTDNIVYDNSWLSDPLKQAEFYTTSATLLADVNNNNFDYSPINYAFEKGSPAQQLKSACPKDFFENSAEVGEAKIPNSQTAEKINKALQSFDQIDEKTQILANCIDGLRNDSKADKVLKVSETEKKTQLNVFTDCFESLSNHSKSQEVIEASEIEDKTHINVFANNPKSLCSYLETNGVIKESETEEKIPIDTFASCVESLCADLKNMKPQKRKRAARNSAPRAQRAPAKPRATRKKPPTEITVKKESGVDSAEEKFKVVQNSAENFLIDPPQLTIAESVKMLKRKTKATGEKDAKRKKFPNENTVLVETKMEVQENSKTTELQIPFTRNVEMEINEDCIAKLDEIQTAAGEQEHFVEEKLTIEDTFNEGENIENFMAAATVATFPCYPPDINDRSILVLDPEAHQLVWTSFSIRDSQEEEHLKLLVDTTGLPELTDADLQNSEIGENIQKIQQETHKMKDIRSNFSRRPKRVAAKRFY